MVHFRSTGRRLEEETKREMKGNDYRGEIQLTPSQIDRRNEARVGAPSSTKDERVSSVLHAEDTGPSEIL